MVAASVGSARRRAKKDRLRCGGDDGKTEEKGGFGFGTSKADDKKEGAFAAGGFGEAEAPAPAAPEKIDASNGEEGDTELHKCRCKAFVLEKPKEGSATWKERGVCVLKVLRDKKGALRVVARRDLTHTLVLNAAPSAVDAHGDKAVRFMAATSEKSADTFLVRVKTKDDRASLLAVLAPEEAAALRPTRIGSGVLERSGWGSRRALRHRTTASDDDADATTDAA